MTRRRSSVIRDFARSREFHNARRNPNVALVIDDGEFLVAGVVAGPGQELFGLGDDAGQGVQPPHQRQTG